MSGSLPGAFVVAAPAKLNLGLEVLGRRNDGFHEIATIFLAIDLCDSLTFTASDELLVRCDDPRLGGEENLVLRALRELRRVGDEGKPSPPDPAATPRGYPAPGPSEPGEGWGSVGRLNKRGLAGAPSPPTPSPCAQGEGGFAAPPVEVLSFLPQSATTAPEEKEPLSHRNGGGVGVRVFRGAVVELEKRIPVAAGLGGASTDAAAALRGGREFWQIDLSDAALREIAAGLGSDVPFFVDGGCALGRGRGEVLSPLPVPPETWFVVVAPRVSIPAKTATLYASLHAGDFGDGSRIAAQAERIRAGQALDRDLLGNAFARALYERCPELAKLPAIMGEAGAPHVAISGAGPAHYAVLDDAERAAQMAGTLRERLGGWAEVFVAGPESERLSASRPL